MKIVFFYKDTGAIAGRSPLDSYLFLFVDENGTVWQDNNKTCESQSSCVSFDDFIEERPDIG
jgi:hypothetical protein